MKKNCIAFYFCFALVIGLPACQSSHQSTDDSDRKKTVTNKKFDVKNKRSDHGMGWNAAHGMGWNDRYWFIQEYDTDKNQTLLQEEFETSRAARLSLMDVDKNGKVEKSEYIEEYAQRLEKNISQERESQVKQTAIRFDSVDTDKNKAISWSEYEASGARAFDFLDKDKSGVISLHSKNKHDKKYSEKNSPASNKAPAFRSVLQMPSSHSAKGFIDIYDVDGDHQVDHQEFSSYRKQKFNQTDSNQDGVINSNEYLIEFENRLDKQAKKIRDSQLKQAYVRFDVLDQDKNADLTLNEFADSGKRIFSRWDVNQDGSISQQEPLPKWKNHHRSSHHKHKAKQM